MNGIKLLVVLMLLSSCCEIDHITKYRYGKIIITRVDECAKTTFYYGDDIDENKGEIWTEYSGFGNGFQSYLKFHENGKVSLLSGDGYYQVKNIDTLYFEYKRIRGVDESPKIGENVCYIYSSTKFEHRDNVSEGSGIVVEYIDKDW